MTVSSLAEKVVYVVDTNPDKLTEYLNGNKGLEGFFMGEIMKLTRGQGDYQEARRLLLRYLELHTEEPF